MSRFNAQMHRFLAALSFALILAACGQAQRAHAHPDPALDALFTQLEAAPDATTSAPIEARIWARWAQSGSPTVDILMDRAQTAERGGNSELAIRFLQQASDLAPDFAEPWDRRANLGMAAGMREVDAYRAALAINPHYELALRGVARLQPKVDGRDA